MSAAPSDASSAHAFRLAGLFAGRAQPLGPRGELSGIIKQRVHGRVWIQRLGLEGDEQADARVHGGLDKAVHQYAAEHYPTLLRAFPEQATLFVPGSMGENLSTHGLTEATVCIGDVFRVGEARLQVSQPRSPCWKIDARFGQVGVMRFVFEQAITGWYYRVLTPGRVATGDAFELIDRNMEAVTLAALWSATHTATTSVDDLVRLEATPGLSENWARKLARKRSEPAGR